MINEQSELGTTQSNNLLNELQEKESLIPEKQIINLVQESVNIRRNIEQRRSEQDKIKIAELIRRSEEIYQKLTGNSLPDSRLITTTDEAMQILNGISKKATEGNKIIIDSPELKSKSLIAKSPDNVLLIIGLDPKAGEGEIAQELFHAYLEDLFLKDSSVKTALLDIAEHIEFQFRYEKYCQNRTFTTGEEMLSLEYKTKKNEIAAHILDDYFDFENESKENKNYSLILPNSKEYARFGREKLVKTVLDKFEMFIAHNFNQSGFKFNEKEKFIEFIGFNKNRAENYIIDFQKSNDYKSQLIKKLDALKVDENLVHNQEFVKQTKILIAQIMQEFFGKGGDELRRIKWLYNFYQQIDSYFMQYPGLCDALKLKGVQNFIGLGYDYNKNIITNHLYERQSREDLFKILQEDILDLETKSKKGKEKELKNEKLSFDEFINNKELLDKF